MVEHTWERITVAGEPWDVSSDAAMVDGKRFPVTRADALAWAERLGAQLPTPAILDARWEQADLQNDPHTQPLHKGVNDSARHSAEIDLDVQAYSLDCGPPRIVGNCGKHWVSASAGGNPLYGWHVPAEATWRGIKTHPAASSETTARVIQPYSPKAHGRNHKDYSMTLVLCRPANGSLAGACAGSAAGAVGGAVAGAIAGAVANTASSEPPDTTPGPPPDIPELRPLSQAERSELFGRIRYTRSPTEADPEAITIHDNWAARNLERVVIPQLASIPGIVHRGKTVGRGPKSGAAYCHTAIAEQMIDLWQAWEDSGLLGRVVTWAGLWCPRLIRGGSTLSSHAWGTAFDINAPWNGLHHDPAAVGERGSVRELVPLAHAFGFFWGGNFNTRPDGMHFEAAEAR